MCTCLHAWICACVCACMYVYACACMCLSTCFFILKVTSFHINPSESDADQCITIVSHWKQLLLLWQVELWKKYIAWEKNNPLRTEDHALITKRGVYKCRPEKSLGTFYSVPWKDFTPWTGSCVWYRNSSRNERDSSVGIAQWVERRTRDWKVVGLNPAGAVGEFSSPWLTFCADSYFSICSTSVLPQ